MKTFAISPLKPLLTRSTINRLIPLIPGTCSETRINGAWTFLIGVRYRDSWNFPTTFKADRVAIVCEERSTYCVKGVWMCVSGLVSMFFRVQGNCCLFISVGMLTFSDCLTKPIIVIYYKFQSCILQCRQSGTYRQCIIQM